MTDYKNWKILKSELEEKQEEYTEVSKWCNESVKYTIEDDGKYYKVVSLPEPAKLTEDELKQRVRSVRNEYLKDTDFTQLNDAPFTSEEKVQYADYRQYLRDYTETENWWQQYPLDFDSWKE